MIPRTLFSSEHETFRDSVRRFMEAEVVPQDEKWQEQGYADKAVWRKAGENGHASVLVENDRLVVCYQPHLVSRTRIFGAAMGAALGAADEVVVLDVYVAREDPDPAVTGRLVADAVPLAAEHVHFVADLADAPAELVRLARPGDLVLTLGAGSVTDVGPLLLALLEDS